MRDGLCRSLLGVLLGLLLGTMLGAFIGLLGTIGLLLGVSLVSLGFIDCFPLKDCQMCPFSVASGFGRYFWTSCLVSPGHVESKLLLISVVVVNVHGLQHTRWRKVLRSAFDFVSYTLPANLCSGILHSVIFSFCSVVRGTMYSVDFLSRVMCTTILLVCLSMM